MPDNTTNSTAPVLPKVPASDTASPAPAAPSSAPADEAPRPQGPVSSGHSSAPSPAKPASPAKSADDSADGSTDDSATPASDSDAESTGSIYAEVSSKISESHNVLIALSGDPSVDEMAAAIGLSLYLDKLGKRATAIYSGSTPNALEFLKPEETFEPTADTLQDFVIALNKDKADHLRYKLDGDFVKIYITPYKTRIAKDDLDFSYGDYNVDLVLALDVANGIDLDSALREHGRIMHDAVIINITTGKPGKFGEIEWSDKHASSVSEMIAKLLYNVNSDVKIGKDEATAFLTGIVAATNRFSNNGTTPETMQVASKLMESGANQQLVAKNITPDVENELFSLTGRDPSKDNSDPTKLDIEHHSDDEDQDEDQDQDEEDAAEKTDEAKEEDNKKDNSLMDDLQAAAASLAQTGAEATPVVDHNTLHLDSPADSTIAESAAEPVSTPEPAPASASTFLSETPAIESAEPAASGTDFIADKPEKVIEPSADLNADLMSGEGNSNKYGQMLEDALNSINTAAPMATPAPEPAAPSTAPADNPAANPVANPAAMNAPSVPDAPEINGVPEMNYMPMPGEEILPPPPTPPINMANVPPLPTAAPVPEPATPAIDSAANPTMPSVPTEPIAPAMSTSEPATTSLGPQPAMQDQVYAPQAADPSAFKIPGM